MVAGGLEMNAQPRLPGLFEPSRLLRPGGTPFDLGLPMPLSVRPCTTTDGRFVDQTPGAFGDPLPGFGSVG